jgi:formate hydrogenlyase subunit 3/multisubunit Na+/H+ antiporter MnhD subunit
MPTQINGLPAHVLLIHVVVVLVPAAAFLLVGQAWSRPVRRWAGVLGPLLCLGALVMVPITTQAGEWFRDHLNKELAASAPVRRHVELGDDLLPWVIAMFLLSVAVFLLSRRQTKAVVNVLVAVLATVVAVGAVVQTVRIGDSGAQAVWKGSVVSR